MTLRRRGLSADPAELLSITERARYLFGLRVGLAAVVVSAAPMASGGAALAVSTSTAAYLGLSIFSAAVVRRGGKAAVPVMQGTLLVDGLYLATAIAQTGGTTEATWLLAYVHVVGVTLLCSYRTGLKLALWHTLLFLLLLEGARTGVLRGSAGIESDAVTLTVAGLWVFALGTALFSAASERQLRRQKHDLSRLSEMVARMDASPEATDIPNVLLDELCSTFGFARGVVLASPRGDLELVAWTEPEMPMDVAAGVDRAVSRAWEEHTSQLLRAIDPDTDPRLASLVPDARNVLIVPLLRDRRQGLGVVVVERGGEHPSIRRWVISMVEQFAEHAALALHNAWLTEERESQLRIIQGLEQQLRAHNEELEAKVAERTEELRDVISNLEEIDEQRRRLLEHVVRVAEEERSRIAHDIHDDPVQKMVALKMRLELFRRQHPGMPDIDDALEVMRVTIRSMRTLLFDLSPPTLEEEGLGSALTYLLENSNSSFDWTIDDAALDEEPPVQTSLILYRIAQEAFANARKHAKAANVRVTLQPLDGGTSMHIVDDGVGFLPQEALVAAPGHLGLAAIRERAEMAGGSSRLWSLPGQGTTLEVWLPSEEAAPVVRTSEDDTASIADVLLLSGRVGQRRTAAPTMDGDAVGSRGIQSR
ncbi:MAG TPA: GAF domain-containing sensor histidine kinase [Actinomycetota bacterium]|nr:GAF domain-containing sensor histidine kinase [Actinomycetota bacterium]